MGIQRYRATLPSAMVRPRNRCFRSHICRSTRNHMEKKALFPGIGLGNPVRFDIICKVEPASRSTYGNSPSALPWNGVSARPWLSLPRFV